MSQLSAMGRALEGEDYQNKIAKAYKAWEAAGNEGTMPCVWQELFECTLLDAESLGRAISWKIELLKRDCRDAFEKKESSENQLSALRESVVPKQGTINLSASDIKHILLLHYQEYAQKAGRKLKIGITLDTEPITDEIWANVHFDTIE